MLQYNTGTAYALIIQRHVSNVNYHFTFINYNLAPEGNFFSVLIKSLLHNN